MGFALIVSLLLVCFQSTWAQDKMVNVSPEEAMKFAKYLIDRRRGSAAEIPLKLHGKEVRLYTFTSGPPDRVTAESGETLLSVILNLPAEKGDQRRWVCYFTVTPAISWADTQNGELDWNRRLANSVITQYNIIEGAKLEGKRRFRMLWQSYRKPVHATEMQFFQPFEAIKAESIGSIEIHFSKGMRPVIKSDQKWIQTLMKTVTDRDYPLHGRYLSFSLPGQLCELVFRDHDGKEVRKTVVYEAWNLIETFNGRSGVLGSNRAFSAVVITELELREPKFVDEKRRHYGHNFSGEYEKEYRDALASEKDVLASELTGPDHPSIYPALEEPEKDQLASPKSKDAPGGPRGTQ